MLCTAPPSVSPDTAGDPDGGRGRGRGQESLTRETEGKLLHKFSKAERKDADDNDNKVRVAHPVGATGSTGLGGDRT